MTISSSGQHFAASGDLRSTAAMSAIPSLTAEQVEALADIGIRRVADLLHFRPLHDARLIAAVARSQRHNGDGVAVPPDLVDAAHRGSAARDLLVASPSVLASVDADTARVLADGFGVKTVAALAAFAPFDEAEAFMYVGNGGFVEPPSAPAELMPGVVGAVHSTATYSSFVKEDTLRLNGVELTYDDARIHFVDLRLATLFAVAGLRAIPRPGMGLPLLASPEPVVELGYVAKHRQEWLNAGTFLGEVVYSLALAPGESRNIAVLDWTRSQRTSRSEDTRAGEQLRNDLFHARAVDEVTRSTAVEHQNGGTTIAAGTLSTAAAGVVGAAVAGGAAATVPGALIGAAIGAVAGAPTGPADPVAALAGAAAGAVIGFGVGAAVSGGAALVGAANAQLGILRSDSSGNRGIEADLRQNISEMVSQKASSLRSLRSNIFVTDEQAEHEQLQSRNITNYNHSHMLNLEYFEVLQHYRVELRLAEAEPLLFLPFRPIDFSFELIRDYWATLRRGVRDRAARERFDRLIAGATETGLGIAQKLRTVRVRLSGLLTLGAVEVKLTGRPDVQRSKTLVPLAVPAEVTFLFDAPGPALEDLAGVSVQGLPDLLNVAVSVSAQTEDDSGRVFRYQVADDQVRASAGIANMSVDFANADRGADDPIGELERYFDERRYFFTRLLLLAIEKEQLIDLVEALQFQSAVSIRFPVPPPFGVGRQPLPGFFTSGQRRVASAALGHLSGQVGERIQSAVTTRIAARGDGSGVAGIVGRALAAVGAELASAPPLDEPAAASSTARGVAAFESALAAEAGLSGAQAAEVARAVKLPEALEDSLKAAIRLPGIAVQAVHLSEFVETTPIAVTGNTLVFKMKLVRDDAVLKNDLVKTHLGRIVDQPASVARFLDAASKEISTHDIHLPTTGVFAEAILGRANASEKIDITRFFNWQDSPIPHLAPRIADLQSGSRAQAPLETAPTVPANLVTIVNPPAFPAPAGVGAALAAVQNGGIFRDMSKAEVLGGVLANLSNLANQQGQLAGNLTGGAQREASQAALSFGNKVADLAAQALQAQQQPPAPQTPTERGGALNEIGKLIQQPQPVAADGGSSASPAAIAGDPRARVSGAPAAATDERRDYQMSIQFLDVDDIPYSAGAFEFELTMSFHELHASFDINGGVPIPVEKEGFFFPETFALTKGRAAQIRIDANIGSTVVAGIREFALPDRPDIVFKCKMKAETQKVTTTDVKSAVDQAIANSSFGAALNPVFERFLNGGISFPFEIFKISADGGSKAALNLRLEYNRSGGTTNTNTSSGTTVTEFEVVVPKNGWDIQMA